MNGHSFELELSLEVLLTSFTSFEVISIFNILFIVLQFCMKATGRQIG